MDNTEKAMKYDHLRYVIDKINHVVEECEDFQKGNDSQYGINCAKLSAYNQICEILGFRG